MATKVSIAATRGAIADKGKPETDDNRVKRLVGLAIKASHDSFNTIADGAAAAVWFAIQNGRCGYMNDLFSKMHPKDSLAFRAYYVRNVIDAYGAGGAKDDETGEWKVKPTDFFQFTAKPTRDGKPTDEYFRIAKSDKPDVAERIKAGLKNAREKTEGEFREIKWVTPEQARTDNILTPSKATTLLISAFKRIAKDLPRSGMGRVELLRMVNSSPLSAKERGDIDALAIASEAASSVRSKSEKVEEQETVETAEQLAAIKAQNGGPSVHANA